jgi:hypothetical protein
LLLRVRLVFLLKFRLRSEWNCGTEIGLIEGVRGLSRAASANPRPAGWMRPSKLLSAALLLPLKLGNLEENQENHWNYPIIWLFLSLFCVNAALDFFWVGQRCSRESLEKIRSVLHINQLWPTHGPQSSLKRPFYPVKYRFLKWCHGSKEGRGSAIRDALLNFWKVSKEKTWQGGGGFEISLFYHDTICGCGWPPKSLEEVHILAPPKWRFSKNVAFGPIWVGHGWYKPIHFCTI